MQLLILVSGCGDPSWIQVDIGWESAVANAIDTIEVEVAASEMETVPADDPDPYRACDTFTVEGRSADRPFELIFASENEDWHWLAVRAVGRREDMDEDIIINEGLFRFPVRGEWALRLTEACLDVQCEGGQVCDQESGECIGSLAHPFLEEGECPEP